MNDVIEHLNPKELAAGHQSASNVSILAAGRWIARGMIVRQNDRTGGLHDRRPKDFPRMNERRIQRPHRHRDDAQDSLLRV